MKTPTELAVDFLFWFTGSIPDHDQLDVKRLASVVAERDAEHASATKGLRGATLEEAAKEVHVRAERLYALMEQRDVGTKERERLSRRASEWFEAARTIRALKEIPTPKPSPGRECAADDEVRCDWKSWCVRIDGHEGDCEPSTPSRLYDPKSPVDSARVLAVGCGRCKASAGVRCAGSINEPVQFHYARFVLASVEPGGGTGRETT